MIELERAIAAASGGDFEALSDARAAVQPDATPEVHAWRAAADALSFLAGVSGAALPDVREIEALAATGAPARRGCATACRWLVLAAALSFDLARLERAALLHGKSAKGEPDSLWANLSEAWVGLAKGSYVDLASRTEAVERAAARVGDAALVVDAASLRALLHAGAGELDSALEHARRASRMARTEALPQSEYLANLALARIRRLTGRPHLAARILGALAQLVPPAWRGAIGWELAMASGPAAREILTIPGPALELVRLLDAAAAGDVKALDRARQRPPPQGWPMWQNDVLGALAVIGVPTIEGAPPQIGAWQSGASHQAPFGLSALATSADGESSIAWVLGEPNGSARRILSIGTVLAASDAVRLPESSRSFARTDAIVASLAFAGTAGLAIAELFRDVWGFKYAPSVHNAVLDTALHRARARIAAAGTIEREGERLCLRLERPVLLPDPRCELPAEERVLAFVARHGRASAQLAADALGIPLRSAQASLKLLVEDGACRMSREGRRVDYQVEDTTFQEPTQKRHLQWSLHPEPLQAVDSADPAAGSKSPTTGR